MLENHSKSLSNIKAYFSFSLKHAFKAKLYIAQMNTYARIKKLALASGVPPRKVRSTLAAICGISPQAVADWETGKTKKISPDHLLAIGERYQVTVEYLISGKAQAGLYKQSPDSNIGPAVQELNKFGKDLRSEEIAAQLPILNSNQAISPASSIAAGDVEGYLGIAPDMKLGKGAFYFRIEDNSMMSVERPLFRPGTLVLIDPTIKVEPGMFVLARVVVKGETTTVFRAYFEKEPVGYFDAFELVPLNQAIKKLRVSKPEDGEVIGGLAMISTPATDLRY